MNGLPPILHSKKFVAAMLAVIISFFGMREGMTSEQIMMIISPLGIFIGAQGLADIGKEKVKEEARNGHGKRPDPPMTT